MGLTRLVWLPPPPMEPSLVAYLAPSHNQGVGGPTSLPSKHCRFSASQLDKIYRAQTGTTRALSSVTMLQTYQAMCLAELGSLVPPDGPMVHLLNKIRVGRGMASTVVAQRHLWLTLSDVPERDRAVYLDEPVSAEGLFGQSLDAIQAKFEIRKKQTEAWHNIIPKRNMRPRPASSVCKPAVPPPPPKRAMPPASLGPQPTKPQPPTQTPHSSAWNKGLPPGLRNDSVSWRRKPHDS